MKIKVNVIIVEGIRKPDFDGSFVVVNDLGDTMEIEVSGNLEEKVAEHDAKIVTMEETIGIIYGGV